MMTQVENTPDGYVVSAYLDDGRGYGRWTPLRNFGDRQGDAKVFAYLDLPEMDSSRVQLFALSYRKDVRYRRIRKGAITPDK